MYRLIPVAKLESFEKQDDQAATSPPLQRKTTLKWGSNGELSSIDMTRILARLEGNELRECDLSCDVDQ